MKAIKFIKQETRNAVKIITKKRCKWMNRMKKQITKQSLQKTWNWTMGETSLEIDQYVHKVQNPGNVVHTNSNHTQNSSFQNKKRKQMD